MDEITRLRDFLSKNAVATLSLDLKLRPVLFSDSDLETIIEIMVRAGVQLDAQSRLFGGSPSSALSITLDCRSTIRGHTAVDLTHTDTVERVSY